MGGWRKGALLLLAATLWAAGLHAPASASSTSLVAGADAFVLSSNPNANRGTASSIRIRNGVKNSYLRFDVPSVPSGESVKRATLDVYALGGSKCALVLFSQG